MAKFEDETEQRNADNFDNIRAYDEDIDLDDNKSAISK